MDTRFISFSDYIKSQQSDVMIIEEKQAIQLNLPMDDDTEQNIIYDILFNENHIDKVQIVGFYGYINYLTKELYLAISQCNEVSSDCTYVIHKSEKGIILRIMMDVPAFCDNKTRNLRIMSELRKMHYEVKENIKKLIVLWN